MTDRAAVVDRWNDIIARFLEGEPAVPAELQRWYCAYAGRGRGAIVVDALPEPWIGSFDPSTCRGVILGLNPGHAHLELQGRDGVFADEIRALGSYAAWAASWPYLREVWEARKGPNRYHRDRLRFLQRWTGDPDLDSTAMLVVEMYPWHSTSLNAPLRADPGIMRGWVLQPIADLGAPVFAFGAPWLKVLPALGLCEVDRLGNGGRPYRTKVASRTVVVFDLDGVPLIAEKHTASAGPPSAEETSALRAAVGWRSGAGEERSIAGTPGVAR